MAAKHRTALCRTASEFGEARVACARPLPERRHARHPAQLALSALRREAAGSRKSDVDGNEIIDYVMGHGALLLGHASGRSWPRSPRRCRAARTTAPRTSWRSVGRAGAASRAIRGAPALHVVRHRSDDDGAAARARVHRPREDPAAARALPRLERQRHRPAGREGTVPASPGLPRGILDASIVIPQNDVATLERTLARTAEPSRR